MPLMRSITIGFSALMLAAVAAAQIEGPAPLAWRFFQPTSVAPSSSPTVVGNKVYYSLGPRVYCLDLMSGNQRWRFPVAEPIEGAFRSAPILYGDTMILAGDNQIIYGVNPETGDLKWTYNSPSRVVGQPVLVGKFLVAAQNDNKLIAIYADSGKDAWETEGPLTVYDGIMGGIAVSGDNVLLFTGRSDLLCINVSSRQTVWKRTFDQLEANVKPLVWEGNVYVPSGPYLVCLDAVSGRPRWSKNTNLTQLLYSAVAGGDKILVTSSDGKALAFDSSGKPVTKAPIDLGSAPITSATYVGGKYIVLTSNGSVSLIDPNVEPVGAPVTATNGRPDVILPNQKIEAPSKDLLWNYIVRPMFDMTDQNSTSRTGNGQFGGGGGFPGLGGGRQGSGSNNNNNQTQITSIQAAAPAVLVGHTLLVAEKDGSLLAFDKDLGVDLTAPNVKMLWPSSGDQVSGQPPLELIFKIDDDATGVDVRSIQILLDDKPLDYNYTRDGYAVVHISTLGKNKPLTNGRKVISVVASDWYGNKSTSKFSLYIDNTLKPIVRPDQNNTNGSNLPGGNNKGGRGGGGGPRGGGTGGGGGAMGG